MPLYLSIRQYGRRNSGAGDFNGFLCTLCLHRLLTPQTRGVTQKFGPRVHNTRVSSVYNGTRGRSKLLSPVSYHINLSRSINVKAAPTPRPTTAINTPSNIPLVNRALYESLRGLESKAANYISLGGIKLLLRGLEQYGEDSVVRVGVLGLGGSSLAKRVLKVLLADPLIDSRPWEQQLEANDDRPVLLSYGEDSDSVTSNKMFRTIFVPSELLRRCNLELLVSSLDVDGALSEITDAESPLDTILVPRFKSQASAGVGYSGVTYPVHKALLIGRNLADLISFGRLVATRRSGAMPEDMIKLSICTSFSNQAQRESGSETDVSTMDVGLAESAITKFRESVKNSTEYERDWFGSRVAPLADWLTRGAESASVLKKSVKLYLNTLLDDTEARINKSLALNHSNSLDGKVSERNRTEILKAIDGWSESAHLELQTVLDGAFRHGSWQKLKWWKLLWRVDDVTMITEEILEYSWLPDAEKRLIFIAGRMEGVGLLTALEKRVVPKLSDDLKEPIDNGQTEAEAPKVEKTADIGLAIPREPKLDMHSTSSLALSSATFLDNITKARSLLSASVAALQSKAQSLLLQSLSTICLTSGTSVLIYASSPLVSVVDAGVVAVSGFVLAASMLQKRWEAVRQDFESRVRDEGRQVLLRSKDDVYYVINVGGCDGLGDTLESELDAAKQAVKEVRDTLSRMGE